jgi:DDE superfamily endonuclease
LEQESIQKSNEKPTVPIPTQGHNYFKVTLHTKTQKYFNYKLSSARQVVERSFALLFGRFRRLKFIDMNVLEAIPATIISACVLHNICLSFNEENTFNIISDGQQFLSSIDEGVENEAVEEIQERDVNAFHLRDRIASELYLHREH